MATIMSNAAVCALLGACVLTPALPSRADVPFQVDVVRDESQFRVADQRTGVVLLETDDVDLSYHIPRHRAAIEPDVIIKPTANGFNAEFTYVNDRTQPMPLAAMEFKGLQLGPAFDWREFDDDGGRRRIRNADDVNKVRFGYPHGPNKHYSPVAVVETATHVIGFNLLFPVMELEHETLGTLARARGDATGREWNFRWKLSNYGNERDHRRMDYEATLAPGESRTYTVAVRVTDNQANWLQTVIPYRDYFRKTYGGVTYERDPRPVAPISLAGEGNFSAQNPYGFRQENRRPDLYGWGPLLEWIAERDLTGKRVMFWQPSGLQRINRESNYPFKFTSFWLEGDEYGHQMGDAPEQFRRFAATTNASVAFWWGQSTRVARHWDVAEHEYLDIDNPEHVALGFRELDTAVAAGATYIGLDAFGSNGGTPAWDLAKWIEMMRERHPHVMFVTEKHKPDIIHRLGATFFQAYNKSQDAPQTIQDIRYVDEPQYLADFILPGHETWLSFRFDIVARVPGLITSDSFREAEFNRALQMGYVPLMFGGFDWEASDVAAESWRTTVPDALLTPEDPVGQGEDAGGADAVEEPSAPAPREAIRRSPPTVRTHKKSPR